MMLCGLSSDHDQATGSNSHGSPGGIVITGGGGGGGRVMMSPLFSLSPARSHTLRAPPPLPPPPSQQQQQQPEEEPYKAKRKRSQPGNPDPGAEVIALSPRTLVATNRFVCEVCNKGFQRDQNLQLHRRGHNLPWKLRQRSGGGLQPPSRADGGAVGTRKRVYVCPEPSCVHHDPARALGDLTGIKKHFSRKHGEKRWRCERCGKRYAVQSDWKAHFKNCGTREYRCDCGILFSRKDSLLTHRAFCDALAQESARLLANNSITITAVCNNNINNNNNNNSSNVLITTTGDSTLFSPFSNTHHVRQNPNPSPLMFLPREAHHHQLQFPPFQPLTYHDDLPRTAAPVAAGDVAVSFGLTLEGTSVTLHTGDRRLTRDFLGVDDAGEAEELPLPLCATACAQGRPVPFPVATACCATNLTRQYLGLPPPVNETWSHNFYS